MGREVAAPSPWVVHPMIILAQFGYGGAYVLSKFALTTGVPPLVLAVYRDIIALAALTTAAFLVERKRFPPIDRKTLALLASLGAVGIFSSQLLLLEGLALATAALSSVVSITIPVCVFTLTVILGVDKIQLRRRDGKAKLAGLIIAVAGAVLVAFYRGPPLLGAAAHHAGLETEAHRGGGIHWDAKASGIVSHRKFLASLGLEDWQIGVILLFLTGLTLAIYITVQVPTLKRFPAPISMVAIAYAFGAFMLLVTGLLSVRDPSAWSIHRPGTVIAIGYLGLVPSGLNFGILGWAVGSTGPLLLASYTPLQLAITNFLGHVFLGETIFLGSVIGFLLIVGGLFLITWGQANSQGEDRTRKEVLTVGEVITEPDVRVPLLT